VVASAPEVGELASAVAAAPEVKHRSEKLAPPFAAAVKIEHQIGELVPRRPRSAPSSRSPQRP
jgi:hypothetical protein